MPFRGLYARLKTNRSSQAGLSFGKDTSFLIDKPELLFAE